MIDNDISLQCHINHITRTCFYHLRQLRVIRRSLTVDTAHSLVRALVHSRLDYCNGVLAGMHQYQYDRLQSVQTRSAASKVGQRFRVMRRELHWLPYPERVEFKLCSTIYKCLHNSAPQYLIELCIPVATLRDGVICGRLHTATSSYRRRRLRPLALVDFLMLAQWPGTVYSLFLRTQLYPLQCLRNC